VDGPEFIGDPRSFVDPATPERALAAIMTSGNPADLQVPTMFHHERRYRFLPLAVVRIHHLVVGGALLAFGVAALLESRGMLSRQELWLAFPAVVAWSGLVRLALGRSLRAFASALIRFAVAGYLVVVIEHLGGWTFASTWPVLVIAAGLGTIARAVLHRDAREEPTW